MSDLVPNILASVSGRPKAGKTHMSMTFPDPIKVFSFDLGAAFVRTKFPDKEIDVTEITLPIVESTEQTWAEEPWKKFEQDFKGAVESGKYNTVVLDTATVVWQMCHQAITEERNRKKMLEVEYFAPNLKMSSLFARARIAGVNLVVIQYLRDKYVKGDNTGELELDGWKRTEGNVDIVLEMESVLIGEGDSSKTVMKTKIKDCRFDRDLNGRILDDTDYDEIMALLGV